MGNINSAVKVISAASDVNQFDTELTMNLTKLISISKMIFDEYKEEIFEIYASPPDLIQEHMYNLDKITLYIMHSIDIGDLSKWKEDCKEFINEVFKNEYSKDVVISKPKFITQNQPESLLLLDTFLDEPIDRAEETYKLIYSLLDEIEPVGAVSISHAYEHEPIRTMILHITDFSELIYIDKTLKTYSEKYHCEFIEYNDTKTKRTKNSIVYVPVLGLAPLDYDIPYAFYDRQIIEQYVPKDDEAEDNI